VVGQSAKDPAVEMVPAPEIPRNAVLDICGVPKVAIHLCQEETGKAASFLAMVAL
jgi:hypothetical protein